MGGNEECPCGSGQKYKRCCRAKRTYWLRDSRGRAFPKVMNVVPIMRESLMDHLEMADMLDELQPWMHAVHGLALLPRHMQVSVLADAGGSGPMVLFLEATGYLPEGEVFVEWERSGHWMVHPHSSNRYRLAVEDGLRRVVESYPHLNREPLVAFVDAHIMMTRDGRAVAITAYDRPTLDDITAVGEEARRWADMQQALNQLMAAAKESE